VNDKQNVNTITAEPCGSLSISVIQFCRVLSEYGLKVSSANSLAALRALAVIDINDRKLFQHTLRLTLLSRPQDRALFAVLFSEFWRLQEPEQDLIDEQGDAIPTNEADERDDLVDETQELDEQSIDEVLARFSYDTFWQDEEDESEKEEDSDIDTSNDDESQTNDQDPGEIDPQELKRLVGSLARHFSAEKSRRLESHRHGRSLDMRRVIKRSVKFGGTPVNLAWRRKKILKPRLILFVDVSRSMASYAKLLLQFATAVLRHAWHVDVFLFATNLVRVTERQLQDEDIDLARTIAQCGGGTRIGDNLSEFFDDYSHLLTGNRTVAVVLSDGLDRGEDNSLALMMGRLQNRTRQIIWLNPLLELQEYEHTEREMAAALPYIDLLAPAHDLACLWKLLPMLQGQDARLS
jgi:uncharacterized protein